MVHLSYPNASDENVGFALGDGLGRRAPSQFCPAPGCVSCPPSSYLDCWKWRNAQKPSGTAWNSSIENTGKRSETLWDRIQNAQNGLGIARNARSRTLRNGLRARSWNRSGRARKTRRNALERFQNAQKRSGRLETALENASKRLENGPKQPETVWEGSIEDAQKRSASKTLQKRSYMESHGNLVFRSIMGIPGNIVLLICVITYLLNPPDPPSNPSFHLVLSKYQLLQLPT